MAVSKSSRSSELLDRVGRFLSARTRPAERLCVGLSGGVDSVVLLHLLSRLEPRPPLTALHVHHGLSPNADDWAAFCSDVCDRLGIPISIVRVTVPAGTGIGLEAAAREVRYAAFRDCGADCLLLAHHRDDQAETVFFNLLRGSGVTGGAGMPVERPLSGLRLLRPLLDVPRRDIEAYAAEHGLQWIEDESNADTGLSRNFLRHEVMPLLESRFPGAASGLAGAAARFAEAGELLDALASLDWQSCAEGDSLKLRVLRGLSRNRVKNLLRWRLRVLGWRTPAAARLDEFVRQLLTAAPDAHPRLSLPDGELHVRGGRLHWLSPGPNSESS